MLQFIPSSDKYKDADDGNFYRLHSQECTWQEARNICEKDGNDARLAVINNAVSFNATKKLFMNKSFWLAGSDADSEGEWY